MLDHFTRENIIRYGYVPFLLFGVNGLAIWLVAHGYNWWWLLPLYLIAILASLICENILPYHAGFNKSRQDIDRDILYSFTYELSVFNSVVLLPVAAFFRPWEGIWPHDWPLLVQFVMAVIIADIGFMLVHYFSHKNNFMWRFHAVHHSAERLYGFNGLIKHPVQITTEIVVGTAPLVMLGISQEIALLLGFAVGVQLLLQHSNTDYELGCFKTLLAIAPLHRFHHVNEAGKGDVNFGLFLSLWDRLMGTYYYEPERDFRPGDFGIAGLPDYPKDYFTQIVDPFYKTAEEMEAEAKLSLEPKKSRKIDMDEDNKGKPDIVAAE